MTRYLTPPKSLKEADKTFIQDAIEVLETEFKGDLFGESNRPLTETYTTSDGLYHWTNKDFLTYITDLTNTDDVRSASNVLYQNVTKAPEFSGWTTTPAPKPGAVSNTLTPDQLKQFQEKEKVQTAKSKQIRTVAEADVKAAIKRQQEIYAEQIQKAKQVEAALKNQKVYYKVEKVQVEETQEIKNLKQQAEADPKKFIEDTTNQFKENSNLNGLTADEVQIASEQAAIITYDVLTDNSPVLEAAVINKITSDPKLLSKIVPNLEHQKNLKNIAQLLIEQKTAQFELSKQFIDLSKIDGYENSESIKIYLSSTPQEGFKEFDLNQKTVSPSIENLNQQSLLLNNLTEFGEKQIKSRILLGIRNRLESYVAKLPTNSLLARTYSSDIVQFGLSSLGFVKAAPWVAVEGSWIGKIAIGSGFGPLAGFIQAKTGINLGVKLAVKVGAETAVKTGTTAVVKTGLKAVFSKITAALGSAGGLIGMALAWLVGELLVKIIEKIPWKKIAPFLVGLGAFLVAGPLVGVAVGLGSFALINGGISRLTLGRIGNGFTGFLGALGRTFWGTIGMPILTVLLVFPVVVALILFIINSGAYIVPPSAGVAGSCEASEIPVPEGVVKSKDGKYAFPLANAGKIGLSCTHWDKSLATDIFTGHFTGDKFPVLAYTSGVIEGVSLNDSLGGKYIILKGNDGRYYYYAHNCALYVKSGDSVNVGDVIATTDNSGSAAKTPEHSHFAISVFPNFTAGGTVCPSKDFEDKFSLGRCKPSNECVP